jgi:hypothetical protein
LIFNDFLTKRQSRTSARIVTLEEHQLMGYYNNSNVNNKSGLIWITGHLL